ncbi:24101_t:CDS:2, partial [Dentiscutata erythropus]
SGNEEQGKKIFDQISGMVANSYKNFHHFIQKGQQSASSGDGGTPPGSLLSDKVDKITTEIDNFGRAKKQEIMLIRQGARLNDFKEGKLNFNNNPVYKVYLDKTYLTDDEISFVIKEFADNPSVWRIEPIKGNEYFVHSSARGNNNREIGTLIHSKEKFSEGEISPEYGETREGLEI